MFLKGSVFIPILISFFKQLFGLLISCLRLLEMHVTGYGTGSSNYGEIRAFGKLGTKLCEKVKKKTKKVMSTWSFRVC